MEESVPADALSLQDATRRRGNRFSFFAKMAPAAEASYDIPNVVAVVAEDHQNTSDQRYGDAQGLAARSLLVAPSHYVSHFNDSAAPVGTASRDEWISAPPLPSAYAFSHNNAVSPTYVIQLDPPLIDLTTQREHHNSALAAVVGSSQATPLPVVAASSVDVSLLRTGSLIHIGQCSDLPTEGLDEPLRVSHCIIPRKVYACVLARSGGEFEHLLVFVETEGATLQDYANRFRLLALRGVCRSSHCEPVLGLRFPSSSGGGEALLLRSSVTRWSVLCPPADHMSAGAASITFRLLCRCCATSLTCGTSLQQQERPVLFGVDKENHEVAVLPISVDDMIDWRVLPNGCMSGTVTVLSPRCGLKATPAMELVAACVRFSSNPSPTLPVEAMAIISRIVAADRIGLPVALMHLHELIRFLPSQISIAELEG